MTETVARQDVDAVAGALDPHIEDAVAAVSSQALGSHLEAFARHIKLSGTPAERESFLYLQRCLDGLGYSTRLIDHDAYISLPGEARLTWTGGSPSCITHSFSRASAPGGTRGMLVSVGTGTAADFAGVDLEGRVALIDAIANPGASARASAAGAVGQVHISPHEHIHEMCISPVWGSPAPEQLGQLPSTVVVSVAKADGDAMRARVQSGDTVEVLLHAAVDTGWRKTPLLVAEMAGPGDPATEPFVLFSGHHDTWYYGVMDNGAANATMLEVARLCADRRAIWRRGLRFCFWSGHSHGRYSGSTWYADNHWAELAARCAVHVNVDSTGGRGATVRTDAQSSAELRALGAEAVLAQDGQHLAGLRMSRAGDQSFWGIGVPSLLMGMSEQPAGAGSNAGAAVFGGGDRKGAGFGWWWHTPDDTLDKIDPSVLRTDTQIYIHVLLRLLGARVLPLDYAAHVAALDAELATLAASLGPRFDLSALRAAADTVRRRAGRLNAAAAMTDTAEAAARMDGVLMRLGRALVPMDYTTGDRFGHDPALPQSAYPVLDPVRELARSAADSDAALFLAVGARRSCNRLAFALHEAAALLDAYA